MTEQEAIRLIAEYDRAVGDCEKRPQSKAAGKRFNDVFKRLIAAMVKCPCCEVQATAEEKPDCECPEWCPNS